MHLTQISVPNRLTFLLWETREGRKSVQAHFDPGDGRKGVVKASKSSECTPVPGETWNIVPIEIVLETPHTIIVEAVAEPDREVDLSVFRGPTNRRKEPVCGKKSTGRFVGEKRRVKAACLDGPNVIPHVTCDMRDAAELQRRAARHVSRRGEVVPGTRKRNAGAPKTG